MTEEPGFFAERPDPLSEVLATLRLSGGALLRCATADRIQVPAGRRVLHVIEAGPVLLRAGGAELLLATGDMALLVRGGPHELGAPGGAGPRELRAGDCAVVDPPAGYAGPRWLTGTVTVDDTAADELLAVLPDVVVVPRESAAVWFDLGVEMMVVELTDDRPGGTVMIARLLDLLFVYALRVWSAKDAERAPGWLTASLDPQVGRAVAAMHRDLGRQWTVAELAEHVLLSRSVFAERFARLVGSPPMAYLAVRRLDRAAELLRTSTMSVADVGAAVGYTSEAAFSRAFARRYGQPPLRWRRGGG